MQILLFFIYRDRKRVRSPRILQGCLPKVFSLLTPWKSFVEQQFIRTFAAAILAAAALGKNEKNAASCHFFILYAA